MAPTTTTNPRLETYVSNMCSERLRGPQSNMDENPILAQLKEQEFYDAVPNQQSDFLTKRRSTRYASTGVASEQLPAYQETSNAEAYKDCGCAEETNKLRIFVNWTMGNPTYLLKIPGLHIRNPLHVPRDLSTGNKPPQKMSRKVKRAKKEAKKAQKEAVKAKKLALKAKKKAEKVESEAMSTRCLIQKARDTAGAASKDLGMAQEARVRTMRWATSVSNNAQGLRDDTRNALAEAELFYDRADFCDHSLV
ncbi:hypothetical protein PHISCL_01161 [Aspergillus sclerotialis]|uniref:Uncharacterized protein n=1 Tax=Aspergillus sclerotialis TaxID=2070753 RepID=A0A3A2ZTQ3_9EURO|nr:hypothetical protein PHISCL_01161 [Aspergillus sclerotialis]